MTAGLQYFKQLGYHVIVLNSGAMSHFSFIDSMFYNASVLYRAVTKTTTITSNIDSMYYYMSCRYGETVIRDSNTECMHFFANQIRIEILEQKFKN